MQKATEKNFIRSKQRYGMISQNIMRNPFITPTAKALYGYLAGFAGAENSAFPGRDLVCHEMGLNKDTFSKYIWELQCWQIIEIEKIRGQKGQWENNIYILDHYPAFVMMERKDFEESVWPELKGNIKKSKKPFKSTTSPCPKISDMDETGSPYPKKPDTVKPDLVEPDPEISDINNNSLKNNSFKSNNLNNNNLEDHNHENIPGEVSHISDVVVESASLNSLNELREAEADETQNSKQTVIKKGDPVTIFAAEAGIINIPTQVIEQLQKYPDEDLKKIAQTLKDRKDRGLIKNPSGLLFCRPEVPDAILKGEFYPDLPKQKKTVADKLKDVAWRQSDEYEIYVPPKKNGMTSALK